MLARAQRLHRESDIRRVFDHGRVRHTALLSLRYYRTGAEFTRAAVIAGRRTGKAHLRNHIRRQVREAYRSFGDRVASGYDLILLARPPIAAASYALIRGSLALLLQRARLTGKPA